MFNLSYVFINLEEKINININNLIAEIRKTKKIENKVSLSNPKKIENKVALSNPKKTIVLQNNDI